MTCSTGPQWMETRCCPAPHGQGPDAPGQREGPALGTQRTNHRGEARPSPCHLLTPGAGGPEPLAPLPRGGNRTEQPGQLCPLRPSPWDEEPQGRLGQSLAAGRARSPASRPCPCSCLCPCLFLCLCFSPSPFEATMNVNLLLLEFYFLKLIFLLLIKKPGKRKSEFATLITEAGFPPPMHSGMRAGWEGVASP